jgi:hypothetical protein
LRLVAEFELEPKLRLKIDIKMVKYLDLSLALAIPTGHIT